MEKMLYFFSSLDKTKYFGQYIQIGQNISINQFPLLFCSCHNKIDSSPGFKVFLENQTKLNQNGLLQEIWITILNSRNKK